MKPCACDIHLKIDSANSACLGHGEGCPCNKNEEDTGYVKE